VSQLSLSLNNGVRVLYTALNNGLTFDDNFLGTQTDVTLTVDANGKPTQTAAFKLDSTANVNFVTVGLATNNTKSGTYPTGGIFVSGTQASNIYTINNVTGLTAGQSWTIRVRAEQQN
jgi:hypothetical protein